MPDASSNSTLNEILIQVYRSLLQYAVECWAWAAADASGEQRAIAEMAKEQQALVADMARLLDRRQVTVDFGTYPDWSALHFVSLDYLLDRLIDDEAQMIAAIESEQPALRGDGEASAIVASVLASERKHLARLREIAATRKATDDAAHRHALPSG